MSSMSDLSAVLTSVKPEHMSLVLSLLQRYGVKRFKELKDEQVEPFLIELKETLDGKRHDPALGTDPFTGKPIDGPVQG